MFEFAIGSAITGGIVLILTSLIYRPALLRARVVPHIGTRVGGTSTKRSAKGWLRALFIRVTDRVGSTTPSVERRLGVIGEGSVRDFRLTQAQCAGVGSIVGIVIGLAVVARGAPVLTAIATVVIGGICGIAAADSLLTKRAQRASDDMTRELPDVVELLGLSVASGEPIRVSIEHLVHRGEGVLMRQLRLMVDDMHAGVNVPTALANLSRLTGNRHVGRFCETVTAALEQGSGLAGALHAQARDSRDASRRLLMEKGGRAEVSMMIPVVFLILPITVVFTLFPALSTLRFM